jgi:5-methylcytosine-specific restriction endonuclease McrA
VTPLAPERFALQVTIGRDTHDLLRQAQDLLSHSLPSGNIEQVLHRALEHYVSHLEKRKFAATPAPRAGRRRPTQNPRYIPAHVKRAVRQRDQGQCTFVGDMGHRCRARKFLQFDHEVPVARGGSASLENIRLRCSTHNQHEAERVYGDAFMHEKRRAALQARALRRSDPSAAEAGRTARSSEVGASQAAERQEAEDLLAGLRGLGFRTEEARRAVEHCASIGGASLSERMRTALRFLAPRPRLAH